MYNETSAARYAHNRVAPNFGRTVRHIATRKISWLERLRVWLSREVL